MGVGGGAVFSASSSREPWRGLRVPGGPGSRRPCGGQRLTWSPRPQLGGHSLQPVLLPPPPPPLQALPFPAAAGE